MNSTSLIYYLDDAARHRFPMCRTFCKLAHAKITSCYTPPILYCIVTDTVMDSIDELIVNTPEDGPKDCSNIVSQLANRHGWIGHRWPTTLSTGISYAFIRHVKIHGCSTFLSWSLYLSVSFQPLDHR
ncbi:hypothetical protein RND81_13G056900 [Saponaria officinalis]|uniref:Uncharacterized protein n=1 Tax=Saponaria officinalis TaxID=3572 RepID=A0AAW1GYY1_SAPOF